MFSLQLYQRLGWKQLFHCHGAVSDTQLIWGQPCHVMVWVTPRIERVPIKGEDSIDDVRAYRKHDVTRHAQLQKREIEIQKRHFRELRPNRNARCHGPRKYLPVRPEFDRWVSQMSELTNADRQRATGFCAHYTAAAGQIIVISLKTYEYKDHRGFV